MDIKTLSIDSIGLSNRSQNALHRAEVHTVGDMLKYDEALLSEVRNLGKKSIDEILEKIEEYRKIDEAGGLPDAKAQPVQAELPQDFDAWLQEESGRAFVSSWLKDNNVRIDVLELLSARAYNLLMFGGFECLDQVAFMTEADLMQISRMDQASAGEILCLCSHYLQEKQEEILAAYADTFTAESEIPALSIFDMLYMPEYHDAILSFVQANDKDIRQLGLSNRPLNRLAAKNYQKLSDFIFMTQAELQAIPSMGKGSVDEILTAIHAYLEANEARLIAVCTGDASALLDDSAIREMILKQYQEMGFGGLSLNEMKERLNLPEGVTDERLKKIIGGLLAEGNLEYVDFRCYRVYGRFMDSLEACPNIDDRNRECIRKRLQGITLEGVAQEYGLTRERVRQIVKRDAQKVADWYGSQTGMAWFDEDYYRYFYGTYAFEKKDAIQWFGMTDEVCNYLDMMDVKRGKKDLQAALEDHRGLDAGLRLKIKNFLNRNKIYVDGIWVEKQRADIEKLVVRKFCRDDVSFDEFGRIYNAFLEEEEIPFDLDLYFTDDVLRTRENKLSGSMFLLWKQNKKIRYYDIEGRDFSELLDALNLDAYEDIELSTLKLVKDNPEIMERYDIRDQYELHNLLRKIVPEGSYHDFHCERTPGIRFGSFDRDAAILDILIDHAPISTADLCELIHQEYGYDPATIQGTYLQAVNEYYHQGMYRVDQKAMTSEHRELLKADLTGDFYYIDEIRRIYRRLVPDADLEEINPYNLKLMGFTVLSRYVIQNHASLEALMLSLLTKEDIIDLTPLRKRYVYVQMFSQKLMELKRSLDVIEFEPNKIINFRRLERSGITREMIQDFCDAVYDFVEDGAYFSAQSLKQDGFESELYDLGFSDWFYANLLVSDDRFSFGQMFGNIILYKGHLDITIKSFETNLIRAAGSIDTYDLMAELEKRYGCRVPDHLDVVYKVQGTEIYYDKYLDRLYASEELYYRELDETEGI